MKALFPLISFLKWQINFADNVVIIGPVLIDNIVVIFNPWEGEGWGGGTPGIQSTVVNSPCFVLTGFITWSSNRVDNSLFFCLLSPLLSLEVVLADFYQICHLPSAKPDLLQCSSSVNWSRSISCCRKFVIFVATVGLPFCLFYKLFPPIGDLIDLARRFISRLMLIVLSGTKSNRGIKFIPWLGRCNPRLALIAFPGTRAWAKAISYPESSGFLVSGATPWRHQFNRFFWLVMPFLTKVEHLNKFLHFHWAIPHLFERLFLISWKNNRDCHITMPLSLKTMEV